LLRKIFKFDATILLVKC